MWIGPSQRVQLGEGAGVLGSGVAEGCSVVGVGVGVGVGSTDGVSLGDGCSGVDAFGGTARSEAGGGAEVVGVGVGVVGVSGVSFVGAGESLGAGPESESEPEPESAEAGGFSCLFGRLCRFSWSCCSLCGATGL